jgi:hypothetical protein
MGDYYSMATNEAPTKGTVNNHFQSRFGQSTASMKQRSLHCFLATLCYHRIVHKVDPSTFGEASNYIVVEAAETVLFSGGA